MPTPQLIRSARLNRSGGDVADADARDRHESNVVDKITAHSRNTLTNTIDKLRGIMADVQLGDPHLPLLWYDRAYVDGRWSQLVQDQRRDGGGADDEGDKVTSSSSSSWYKLRDNESSCDLWSLYRDDNGPKRQRYMQVRVAGGTCRDVYVRYSANDNDHLNVNFPDVYDVS